MKHTISYNYILRWEYIGKTPIKTATDVIEASTGSEAVAILKDQLRSEIGYAELPHFEITFLYSDPE